MLSPIASPSVAGFNISGRLADRYWRNEAESGSLALGLTSSSSSGTTPIRLDPSVRTAAFRVLRHLHTPLRNYTVNGQLPWAVPFNCQEHTGIAGLSERREKKIASGVSPFSRFSRVS